MNNTADKIWQQIKQKNIKPISKQKFFWKRFLLWIICFISLVFSTLITATVIFLLNNMDWDIASRFTSSKIIFVFFALPYFWLLFLAIFYFALYYNYRHTKYGYRIKISLIVLFFFIFNLIFGITAYKLDFGYKIEEFVSNKISFYSKIDTKSQLWSNAEKGLLAGKILSFENNQAVFMDLENKTWLLSFKEGYNFTNLNLGEKIKIIGKIIGKNEFLVEEIRPWCGCKSCLDSNSFCESREFNNDNTCTNGCKH